MDYPSNASGNEDPLVLTTFNQIKVSAVEKRQSPNLILIKKLITMIVDRPQNFERIAQQIRGEFPCDSALDFLKSVLSTEMKAAPAAPDDDDLEDSHRRKTRSWVINEDHRLLMGVHIYGENNWSEVSEFVGGGRTRSQCSQRWFRVIDPKISHDKWHADEENKLMLLVSKYGEKNWIRVAQEMGGRSDVQCRYKYRKMVSRTNSSKKEHEKESVIEKPTITDQNQFLQNDKPIFTNISVPSTFQNDMGDNRNRGYSYNQASEKQKKIPILDSEQYTEPFSLNSEKSLFGPDSIFSMGALDM